jgi:hypothetical protein
MADPYRQQLDLNPAPISGASAEDMGAGAARGVVEAGYAIDDAIHQLKQRDRDQQAAQAGTDFADASLKLDEKATDLRAQAAPGAAGHAQAMGEQFDQLRDQELAKIRDPRLRQAFTQRYAELRANVVGREYGWEAATRVDKFTNDYQNMGDTLAAGQASNPDAVGLQVSLDTVDTVAHHLAVPADLQDKLAREAKRKIGVAWGNAMQNKDPQLLVAALDHGLLNNVLEGNDINVLRDGGLNEVRRADAAARALEARQEAAARETIATGLHKVGDGYVPSAEEFASWQALAKQYNLSGPDWDLGVAQTEISINHETSTWTPTQWHGEINDARGERRQAQPGRKRPNEDARGKGAWCDQPLQRGSVRGRRRRGLAGAGD